MLQDKQLFKLDIKIDSLTKRDLPEIAMLYQNTFSHHFLGHMGQEFLMLFCSQFMNSSINYGYVAKCNGKTVGFLFGTVNENPFYQFYRQNFIVLSLIVMKRYLMDSYVRKHIAKRLGYILIAIKTLLPSSKRVNNAQYNKINILVSARLLAIGVDSNYRGLGIANKLTSQFCVEMKSAGYKMVELSVLAWNKRAISFYKKDGWIQEESTDSIVSFCRFI